MEVGLSERSWPRGKLSLRVATASAPPVLGFALRAVTVATFPEQRLVGVGHQVGVVLPMQLGAVGKPVGESRGLGAGGVGEGKEEGRRGGEPSCTREERVGRTTDRRGACRGRGRVM